jgi:hypothetical protein
VTSSKRTPSAVLTALVAIMLVGGTALPAMATLAAPNLVSPTNGDTVGANPELHWDALTGAVKYRVQVSADGFSTFKYNKDTYNTYATPDLDLPLGNLEWRVAGIDSASVVGDFSSASFIKEWADQPVVTAPSDGATLVYPTDPLLFTWEPLPGAKSYHLEFDDNDQFTSPMSCPSSCNTENTSFTMTTPITTGQTFYWHVRGVSATTGVNSFYSDTRNFSVSWTAVPTLASPVSTTVQDVAFSWSAVTGASSYVVHVSTDNNFNSEVTPFPETALGTKYSPASGLNNDTYFWKVCVLDSQGNAGGCSNTATFTRAWPDQPTLLTPADDDFDVSDPTYSWTPVKYASYYQLQVGTDVNFSNGTYDDCITNRTTFLSYERTVGSSPSEPGNCGVEAPAPGIQYFWRVRGIDYPKSINGIWSDTFDFIYNPALVTMTSPSDGATVSAPVLTWTALEGIEKYKVTIKKSGGTTVETKTTYANTFSPTVHLDPVDSPFSWYVQTIDHEGKNGLIPNSNNWFEFTLEAPGTTFASPTPTAPTNGASSIRMPSLQWQPVTGADHYKVFYSVSGSPSEFLLDNEDDIPFAAYTSVNPALTPETYSWRVEAYTSLDGVIAAGSSRTFIISNLDVLGTSDYLSPPKCTPQLVCDALLDTPTLSWNAVPGAAYYEVHVAADAAFTNELTNYETQWTSMSVRESFLDSQAGTAYFWFVRPCKSANRCGPFNGTATANASAFRKTSPAIERLLPADGSTAANQITFTWRDYLDTNLDLDDTNQEARQYHLLVSTVNDFSSILDNVTVDQTTHTAWAQTYPEGQLYWKVQAIDGSGNGLTYSSIGSVMKVSPATTLTLPADDADVTGVPFFQWAPQTYAKKYTIEIYKNADLTFSTTNRVLNVTTELTAYSPVSTLPAGDYVWRVRRVDASNRNGPWTTARTFSLGQTAPTLLLPSNGFVFTNNNMVFSWGAVAGAAAYRFEVSKTSNFTTLYHSQKTVMTEWAPFELYANGTYYWRVRLLDADGNVLSTSATRNFKKATLIEQTSSAMKTVWDSDDSGSASGGHFHASKLAGSSASFRFKATTVRLLAKTASNGGYADVYLDGTRVKANLSFYSASTAYKTLYSRTVSNTTHTLQVRVLGTKPASSSDRWVFIDGFKAGTTTYQETSSAVTERFSRVTNGSASGGSYDVMSHSASGDNGSRPYAQVTFKGTRISWVAVEGPSYGKATVYVDGVKKGTVDLYDVSVSFDRTEFTSATLTNATHTLKIYVDGTKNTSSTGYSVSFDKFLVT